MENNNNPDDENRYNTRYEKGVTELLEEKELKTKWHKEILENDSMQEYFKSFQPSTVDTFILFYLTEKYLAYKYADFNEKQIEAKRSRWIDEAHEHLGIIQQKKLFDLQCLWRAEQVTLEGVQICADFDVWSDDILNCPFLEPVTEADIKMYQDFLLTTDADFRTISDKYDLQEYEQFKLNYKDHDDGLQLPEWYEYHNMRTGNSALLLLPDTRGEKEDFYSRIYWKNQQKDQPEREPYVPDERPYLSISHTEKVMFFVNTFEDAETQKKYTNYKELHKKDEDQDFDVNELIMDMAEEEEYIPIEAHYDYRIALYKAYNSFKMNKLAEHMPLAHEQYLFNRKMGFTIENGDTFYGDLRDKYLERILEGRELNGEPRNLDF